MEQPRLRLAEALAQCTRSLRKETNTSRPALAERSGIAERTLARRETGQWAWTTDDIEAVAVAFDLDVETLLRMTLHIAGGADPDTTAHRTIKPSPVVGTAA